jgi:hypothetical protein
MHLIYEFQQYAKIEIWRKKMRESEAWQVIDKIVYVLCVPLHIFHKIRFVCVCVCVRILRVSKV